MTSFAQISYYLKILGRGLWLRCPNCGQGVMFRGLFKMEATCPECHVRYERKYGESIGGMFINLLVVETISVAGYFISDALLKPPLIFQLIFWGTFNLVFVILFYRHARALWVAISPTASTPITVHEPGRGEVSAQADRPERKHDQKE